MSTLKRKLIALVTLLALLVPALPAVAHTAPHAGCEYAHGRQADGGSWAHSTRVYNDAFSWWSTVVSKTHMQWVGPPSGGYWNIVHITQTYGCGYWYL